MNKMKFCEIRGWYSERYYNSIPFLILSILKDIMILFRLYLVAQEAVFSLH